MKDSLRSGGGVSGDLVEGGVANLIDADLRSSLDHFSQGLEHSWIGIAAIGIRVFFLIPQTDSESFRAPWDDQCHFVAEALLLPEQGKNVHFDQPGELPDAIGLQVNGNTTSKHINLLVVVWLRGRRERISDCLT